MVLMVNWFLPHPLFSSQMILIFWEPGLRGIVFFLLNELSNSLVNGRSWPTSRWFLPWSVKWPPSGAMTATPVVSASIKLFSNLLCTNFQITCQLQWKSRPAALWITSMGGVTSKTCLSKGIPAISKKFSTFLVVLSQFLLFLNSCEKLVSKYFLAKHGSSRIFYLALLSKIFWQFKKVIFWMEFRVECI